MAKVLLFLGVALLFAGPTAASAQKIDRVASLEVGYWRAFHSEIKLDVDRNSDGELMLNCVVIAPSPSGNPQEKKYPVKKISEADLAPVLKLFNDEKMRQAFAAKPIERMADGSALSITVTQNSYSLRFTAQSAFGRDAPPSSAELGRVAVALFRLAGLTIPTKELY